MDNPKHVVITRLPAADYLHGYVSLPIDYGTPSYFQRNDIRFIYEGVEKNLKELDSYTGWTQDIRGKEVLLKPNLVTVYHHLGTKQNESPETTDPRVLDAIIAFIKKYTRNIAIIESSGRGIPTQGAFHIAGYDRIARFHGIKLIALDEQPVSYYLIPNAKVMREVALPGILDRVVSGDAYYISIPKMKTNLYTEVTLGIKSGMGLLPYNLRQRNHNYSLDQKLVDLLHLVTPDLTIIDGIVGGEGNCPAPVYPVDSRLVISSDNVYACDHTAIQIMGLDPNRIPLIQKTRLNGFACDSIIQHGDISQVPFKKADPMLTSAEFESRYPNVQIYVGFSTILPEYFPEQPPNQETIQKMELRCRGGCLAATRFAFDMVFEEGITTQKPMSIVIGDGVPNKDGMRYYFSKNGESVAANKVSELPNTLSVGSCSSVAMMTKQHVKGCMPYPNAVHVAVHKMMQKPCRVISFRNRYFIRLLIETIRSCEKRKSILRTGKRIDLPLQLDDCIQDPKAIFDAPADKPWIKMNLPPLTTGEVHQFCRDENMAVLATFL